MPEDFLADYLVNVLDIVDRAGWAVQYVGPTIDDPGVPFAYTVGLSGKDPRLPEFLVRGLPPETASGVLNGIAERSIAGADFVSGRDYFDLLGGGYEVRFEVAGTSDLSIARRLYSRVDALQVVFPDAEHRFPWDSGYAGPPQPPWAERPPGAGKSDDGSGY